MADLLMEQAVFWKGDPAIERLWDVLEMVLVRPGV
jgi:hypothetical protein